MKSQHKFSSDYLDYHHKIVSHSPELKRVAKEISGAMEYSFLASVLASKNMKLKAPKIGSLERIFFDFIKNSSKPNETSCGILNDTFSKVIENQIPEIERKFRCDTRDRIENFGSVGKMDLEDYWVEGFSGFRLDKKLNSLSVGLPKGQKQHCEFAWDRGQLLSEILEKQQEHLEASERRKEKKRNAIYSQAANIVPLFMEPLYPVTSAQTSDEGDGAFFVRYHIGKVMCIDQTDIPTPFGPLGLDAPWADAIQVGGVGIGSDGGIQQVGPEDVGEFRDWITILHNEIFVEFNVARTFPQTFGVNFILNEKNAGSEFTGVLEAIQRFASERLKEEIEEGLEASLSEDDQWMAPIISAIVAAIVDFFFGAIGKLFNDNFFPMRSQSITLTGPETPFGQNAIISLPSMVLEGHGGLYQVESWWEISST